MVTYDGLFQFSLVLIAVITLCVTINKKKSPPSRPKVGGYSLISIEGEPFTGNAFSIIIITINSYFVKRFTSCVVLFLYRFLRGKDSLCAFYRN